MKDVYELHIIADGLLGIINQQPNSRSPLTSLQSEYHDLNVVQILTMNNLASVEEVDGIEVLGVTGQGKLHLSKGGFRTKFNAKSTEEIELSFGAHLEKNAGLIGIFGVFNAVLLFSSSKEFGDSKSGLASFGSQIVTISMFVISIMVLQEIIQNTSKHAERGKFQLFYLCICATFIGITSLFAYSFSVFILIVIAVILLIMISITITSQDYMIPFRLPVKILLEKKDRGRFALTLTILLLVTLFLLAKLLFPELFKQI